MLTMKLSVVAVFFFWFSKPTTGVLAHLKNQKLSFPNIRSLSEAVTSTETHRLVGNSENAEFGTALALRGDSIFVGSPEHDNGSGKLSAYNLDSGKVFWEIEGKENDKIGSLFSVSGDGKRVAMAHRQIVTVYNFDGLGFIPMVNQPLVPSGLVNCVVLSSDGTQLAVSDNYDSLNKGRVTVFTLSHDSLIWEARAEFVDSVNQALFGSMVCFSKDGDRIAIAAWNRSKGDTVRRAGMVRVYGRSIDGSWVQVGTDLTGNVDNEQFGRAMTLSGDGQTLVIGSENSMGEGRSRGSVWVYKYTNKWTQVGQKIIGEKDLDRFGRSVTVSGDGRRFSASSYFHNAQRGQVRVFDLDEKGSMWHQVLEIEGEESQDRMGFGSYGLEMSDDGSHLVIGVIRASDDTVGLNDVGAVLVLDVSSPRIVDHVQSPLPPVVAPSSDPPDANGSWPSSTPFLETSSSPVLFASSPASDILTAGPSSTDWSHPSQTPSEADPTLSLLHVSLGPSSYSTTSSVTPTGRASSMEATEMPTYAPSVPFITISLSNGNSPQIDEVNSAGLRGGTSAGARTRDGGMLGVILVVAFTNFMF